MQKIKIISIFFLLFLFQNIYAQTEKIIIDKESEYYLQIDKDNCLKIIISDSSNKTSKIIFRFFTISIDNPVQREICSTDKPSFKKFLVVSIFAC